MSPSTSLFAILIGITSYRDTALHRLSYSASDALKVRDFLKTKLQVPTRNILLITEELATHDTIITHFRNHLTHNDAINRGDSILFYFAGYGSRYPPPSMWQTDRELREAICPFDRGTKRTNGSVVPDILDETLRQLLAELALAKGDNITVILDYCNSRSASSGLVPIECRDLQVRYADPIESEEAVSEMLGLAIRIVPNSHPFRGPPAVRNFRHPDINSHVLLAACRQGHSAYESHTLRAGLFTYTLLTIMELTDLTSITYRSLNAEAYKTLSRGQHPQVEGRNKHRILFDGRDHAGDDNRLVHMHSGSHNSFRVGAGAIHGVVDGTVFTVPPHQLYPSDTAAVIVVKVYTTWSVAVPMTSVLPAGGFARVSYWANCATPFKISFRSSQKPSPLQLQVQDTLDQLTETNQDVSDIYLVRDDTSPQVHISVDEKGVVFERKDELIAKANATPIISWTRAKDWSDWDAINTVARFNLHLYRENSSHPYRDDVRLCLYTLQDDYLVGQDHISDGLATLTCSNGPEELYAIVVKNRSDTDLWCSLYYFDPSDYSITEMYSPPFPTMLPPLRKDSPLVMGKSKSGIPPFTFTVRPGELHDAGFLKLFVSERYADLALIEQGGFGEESQPRQVRKYFPAQTDGQWDTSIYIVDVLCASSTS